MVSSLHRDGSPVERDLRWGVYVVLEAQSDYAAACFRQYGLKTDGSGRFAGMYKPYHLIGMELGISIYSAVLRGEPTGAPTAFRGDAVAVAKRDLKAGEKLDGEGGYTVWGKLIPARRSLDLSALPIGLAKDVRLTRDVAAGEIVPMGAVEPPPEGPALQMRRETCALAELAVRARQRCSAAMRRPRAISTAPVTPSIARRIFGAPQDIAGPPDHRRIGGEPGEGDGREGEPEEEQRGERRTACRGELRQQAGEENCDLGGCRPGRHELDPAETPPPA